ncbi:hypothetical protein GOP47_0016796 [Adiantum capillus-veneris]|uniref:Alpha/beta hydrolase fold-3 domain-containing protein n=1 Tax=Adiantum capillus-veneris TaxID=13818 RepID=A0A9D4UID3_ADICA|nr:hypothetical protein GOP47_0016796 [Adiantum capillus-veneris]
MLQPVPVPPSASHPPDSKGVVPLSTWVLISNFKLSYNLLRRPDGTFNRHLAEFLDRKVTSNRVPVDGVVSMDVLIERTTGVWGRVFWECEQDMYDRAFRSDPLQNPDVEPMVERRDVLQPKPLVIYFHGGSFAHSSANSAIYDAMCRRLAKTCGVVILSVNFRRAPENRYPCAYDDGDSSGGNIAHNVAVRAAQEGLSLAGSILLMPMFGGQARTASEMALDGRYFVSLKDRDWYWRAFLPIGADREHPACNPFSTNAPPLQHLNIPPCLVVVGGYDLLQDWQLRYVYGLKRAGKSVQVMFLEQATMGFFLLPNSELFYSLVERLRGFVSAPQQDAA